MTGLLRRLLQSAFPDAAAEVDLHGLRVPEALTRVEESIETAKTQGITRLRIVCGKGRGSPGGVGVLREAVAGWLDAHGHAGKHRRDVDRDGRDGAIYLDLGGGK